MSSRRYNKKAYKKYGTKNGFSYKLMNGAYQWLKMPVRTKLNTLDEVMQCWEDVVAGKATMIIKNPLNKKK